MWTHWWQPITALPFKGFFSNSKSNLLCNFTRKWSETARPVITRVFLFTLLENWSNICQLHTSWVWSNQHKISPKKIIQWCIKKTVTFNQKISVAWISVRELKPVVYYAQIKVICIWIEMISTNTDSTFYKVFFTWTICSIYDEGNVYYKRLDFVFAIFIPKLCFISESSCWCNHWSFSISILKRRIWILQIDSKMLIFDSDRQSTVYNTTIIQRKVGYNKELDHHLH